MKKKTDKVLERKTVTLPISNRKIFQALADIAAVVEEVSPKEREAFRESVMNELGTEAFLKSFTPSGEIGDNPQTQRIAETFYDSLNDIVGPTGTVTKMMKRSTSSDTVLKNRMFRFKSAIVNLIQLYLDAVMGLKTNDRPKIDRETKRVRDTSFNYPKLSGRKDEQDYEKLLEVEQNRYVRMFVATIFFTTLSDLFALKIEDMSKTIESLDLIGAGNITDPKKLFAHLRNPRTRENFITRTRDIWKIQLKPIERSGQRGRPVTNKKQDMLMDLPPEKEE